MTAWVTLVAAAISLAMAIVRWLEGRGKVDAALSEAILKGLRESDDAIKRAQDARAAARAEYERDPAGMPDDKYVRDD